MKREEYWKLIWDLRKQGRAKMLVVECKRVDLWDGGERHNFGFYISNEVPNEEIEKLHQHCVITPALLTIYKSMAELKENTKLALRKSAWAKLTVKEREALGMIEEPK